MVQTNPTKVQTNPKMVQTNQGNPEKPVPNFKNEVAAHPGGERVLNCFLCGTCTAGCPISELTDDYNPRRIMRKILAGMRDEVLGGAEIWKCYQCHNCVAHCPQDVRFADVIRALREMAEAEGFREAELSVKIAELDLAARKKLLQDIESLLADNP